MNIVDKLTSLYKNPRTKRAPNQKLNLEDIAYIKIAHTRGVTNRILSKKYNVHESTISHIITGRTWV